jgi:hypothetical protein
MRASACTEVALDSPRTPNAPNPILPSVVDRAPRGLRRRSGCSCGQGGLAGQDINPAVNGFLLRRVCPARLQSPPEPYAAERGEIMSDLNVQSVAEGAPGLSQWQRVAYTFSAPSKTFADITRGHRSWWLPFVIMALVGYILFAAIFVKIGMTNVVNNQIRLDPKAEERMAQATPEQREMGAKFSMYITEGVFIANPALMLAGVALLSLGLWGTINFVFGGKATFGSIFAVWMFASLPSIVKSLLGTVVIFAGGEPDTFNIKNFAPTNVAAFAFPNPAEANKVLYSLTNSLDVVTIWTLVLLAIGTAMVAGVKRSSGYIAVFGWWAIFVLVGVGIAAI